MKILFFQPVMGAAGDMINAALYDLLGPDEQNLYLQTMNGLKLPHTQIRAIREDRNAISGIRMEVLVHDHEEDDLQEMSTAVSKHLHEYHFDKHHHHHDSFEHDELHHLAGHSRSCSPDPVHDHPHSEHHHEGHHHHHTHLAEIEGRINKMDLSRNVKNNALEIYRKIAQAEARAHGKEVHDIHFHEVGTLDALADIIGACLLIEMIKPDKIISAPICTGYGTIRCAHGILLVPAPATAFLLEGIPCYAGDIPMEMCTPTGAALLSHFCSSFEQMPAMIVEKTGYGLGKREFEDRANLLPVRIAQIEGSKDQIAELDCNIDDMSGEEIGYAMKILLENGARDVFTTPIGMKKLRPGIRLSVICLPEETERFSRLIFRHTSTLGIREQLMNRYVLDREEVKTEIEGESISIKKSEGYGVSRFKIEFEDLAAFARKYNLSLQEAEKRILKKLSEE